MNNQLKLVTYVESVVELERILSFKMNNFIEVIISAKEISRLMKTSIQELLEMLDLASKNKLDVILLWDILEPQDKFIKTCEFIDRLLIYPFGLIRVQDPGAAHYIKMKYPHLKIQLILENSNHNLEALKKWEEFLGEQGERLILSNEISKDLIAFYQKELKISIEVLVFGPLLLFYSPRKLLSPLEKKELELNYLVAVGKSEESPHAGFPIIENRHGTFMFNVKDLYLLDQLKEIHAMGINYTRVDLRLDGSFNRYIEAIVDWYSNFKNESELLIKENYIRPLIKGFYNINKSNVLFSKLKNKKVERQDDDYIGEVVDVDKKNHLAIMIKTSILNLDHFKSVLMRTPDGKEKMVELSFLKTSGHEDLTIAYKDQLVLVPYVNGVTVKTQVYRNFKT